MTSPAEAPAGAPAEAGQDEIVRVVAIWRSAPGNENAVRGIARELAAATRGEPGCARFDVLESASRPGNFVLIEQYAGAAAQASHLASRHFNDLVLTQAVPLLAHRDVQVYNVLTLEGNSNP